MNEYREIGTFGQYTVQMSLDDLREIANKEVSEENKILREKLDFALKLLESIRFECEVNQASEDEATFELCVSVRCKVEKCLKEIEK